MKRPAQKSARARKPASAKALAPKVPPRDSYVGFLEAKLATEMGPHEAREAVEAGTAVLLDVRSDESWHKGFVPGALHIPRKALPDRVAELPKNRTIVCYCSDLGCQASLKATIELRKRGFDARHMVGGYKFWTEKGYETTVPTTQIRTVIAGR